MIEIVGWIGFTIVCLIIVARLHEHAANPGDPVPLQPEQEQQRWHQQELDDWDREFERLVGKPPFPKPYNDIPSFTQQQAMLAQSLGMQATQQAALQQGIWDSLGRWGSLDQQQQRNVLGLNPYNALLSNMLGKKPDA